MFPALANSEVFLTVRQIQASIAECDHCSHSSLVETAVIAPAWLEYHQLHP